MEQHKKIVVIGAGICGLSAAIWLRRAGHQVTLLDKEGPGAGASFGNAGLLAQWAIVPVNTPDILRTGLKYLADPNSPLFMQWSHLPRLAPWLLAYVRHGRGAGAQRMTDGLLPLVSDSVEQHRALTRGTSAEPFIATSDLAYVYTDRAAFDRDAYGWAIKRAAGYIPELIEGDAVREFDPMLGPDMQCLAVLRDHGHITNPGAYMQVLARVFEEEGGTLRRATVEDITLAQGRIASVETDEGSFPCDACVMAAGIWSKPLLKKLGIKVPLEPERGYHLHFSKPSQMPRCPMMIAGKFAVNPMEHGLRCAGTVELGGITKGPSRAPFRLIRRHVGKLFPNLTYESAEEWMGFRPSTPDSLPLVGEIGSTGVHAAFGHQHVGLTGGPRTGRWVADLISGRHPNIDLAPYDANRFS
ncbi:FAD-binding oxidoreductase [Roseovarius sp. SCSIO 43702]|uniref:NAD(P)/FAD-dependent oxidoreductase n=1 Tax=Roseovarius sp. SCSIO 43702 TaxID=2823043 RepID=UPI001C73439E|nr:FAD-binding oxidoreductase [Roseovarius sp. SCSIO 43702]QYX56922.1 FAD-binding oxidoreductase [Roseovarius sp. SCSIO 43702]